MLELHVRNEANSLIMSYNTLLIAHNFSGACGLELPISRSADWLAAITPTRPADLECVRTRTSNLSVCRLARYHNTNAAR